MKDYKIYVYGAGRRGKRLIEMFPDICWSGLIDCKSKELKYNEIPIYRLDVLEENCKKAYVIISNYEGYREIKNDLLKLEIPEERIIVFREYEELVSDEMYFDECIKDELIGQDAYFVDGGGYDGFNTISYLKRFFKGNESNAKVAIFEPDAQNIKICREKVNCFDNIEVYQLGLSNLNEHKFFIGGWRRSSLY